MKTMKRYVVVLAILLLAVTVAAQQSESYKMPRGIGMLFVSPDSSYLGVLFTQPENVDKWDETVQVGIFDLESRRLTYLSPKIAHKSDGFKALSGGMLVSTSDERSYTFSLKGRDGREMWKEKGVTGLLYKPDTDIGLVLRETSSGPPVELKAISLTTGETFWCEPQDYSFIRGLRSIHKFGKSTVLLLADKIYKYGRKNGLLATKNYKTSPQGANVPVVVSGGRAYVAEWKKLTCLDGRLEEVWSVSHPALAKNQLKDDGSTLLLVNYGYVKSDSKLFPVSRLNKPFVARYDKESGRQLSLDYLDFDKKNGLIEAIYNDTVLYVKNGESFRPLRVGRDEFVAVVESGDVYQLDSRLKVTAHYADRNVYYRLFESETGICIGRRCPDGNDICLVSASGAVLRHFPVGTVYACRVGGQIFYAKGDTLYCEF